MNNINWTAILLCVIWLSTSVAAILTKDVHCFDYAGSMTIIIGTAYFLRHRN